MQTLRLPIYGQVRCGTVSKGEIVADYSEAEVVWLGERRTIEMLVSEGADALIGTGLLDGAQLFIDYKSLIVTITL